MPPTYETELRLPLASAVTANAPDFGLARARENRPALSRATEPADLDDEELLDLITEHGSELCRKYGGLHATLEGSDVDLARDELERSERTRLRTALEIGQRFITTTINRGDFLTSTAQSRRVERWRKGPNAKREEQGDCSNSRGNVAPGRTLFARNRNLEEIAQSER